MRALFIIVNAGFGCSVLEIGREAGLRGATILNARGESREQESIMGITVDTEKEMILCVTDEETAAKAMAAITEKAGITTPSHSVCFTMPVEQVMGLCGENEA